MTSTLERHPDIADDLTISPGLSSVVKANRRGAWLLAGIVVGFGAGWALNPGAHETLLTATVAVSGLTAVAANWSTCGLSVAGVVAAPKQPGRPGASTPARRLALHAAGSLLTGSAAGAMFGALGALVVSRANIALLLGLWALVAVGYGLHELGAVKLPTPMRRQQLPRHWRRTMAPRKVAFLFGAIIGPGFLIFIRSSAYYLLVLGVVAIGSPVLGAALFCVVSLGRCGPSLAAIVHTRRGGTMPAFLRLSCRIDRQVQVTTGVTLAALAAFAAMTLI
jgi:hypothetical protein